MKLKAYRINEYEAWAGETMKDAIRLCARECGITHEEAFDDAYAQELPGDMEIADDDGGTTNIFSILASMNAQNKPGFVCGFGEP